MVYFMVDGVVGFIFDDNGEKEEMKLHLVMVIISGFGAGMMEIMEY